MNVTVRATCHTTYNREDNSYTNDYSQPQSVELRLPEFDSREDAEASAALFPKSSKFVITSCGHIDGTTTYSAGSRAVLVASGVNGGKNETGIKRYRSIVARADKLGVEIEFRSRGIVNTYADRESFESAIA